MPCWMTSNGACGWGFARLPFFDIEETERSLLLPPDHGRSRPRRKPMMRSRTSGRQGSLSPWPSFDLCSLAMFLVMLDTTVLFVAFHGIRASFAAASMTELSWVLNAYTIVYGALLVPAGRLADLYGRKQLFLVGVALFTVASALCGFAVSALVLVGFRLLQAVGGALLTPASLALILA